MNFSRRERRDRKGGGPRTPAPLRGQPPAGGYPSRSQMEVIFCRFSDRDAVMYENLINNNSEG